MHSYGKVQLTEEEKSWWYYKLGKKYEPTYATGANEKPWHKQEVE